MDKDEIINLEAEEVQEDEDYIDTTLYGVQVRKRIIPPLSELNARAKFNQLNKQKPAKNFSWEEIENLEQLYIETEEEEDL